MSARHNAEIVLVATSPLPTSTAENLRTAILNECVHQQVLLSTIRRRQEESTDKEDVDGPLPAHLMSSPPTPSQTDINNENPHGKLTDTPPHTETLASPEEDLHPIRKLTRSITEWPST